MKGGILSVQRKTFIDDCHKLLEENHEITLEEFETIEADYSAYKELGGNGKGTALFEMVKKKAINNITD